MAKLQEYIDIVIAFRQRSDGNSKYISTSLRKCTSKDFEERGISFQSESEKKDKLMRLCPDMEKMESFFRIKNGYTNNIDRSSFSLDIVKCRGEFCKSDSQINDLL